MSVGYCFVSLCLDFDTFFLLMLTILMFSELL